MANYMVGVGVVFGAGSDTLVPPHNPSINMKTHCWLSARDYLKEGWILTTHESAVKLQAKVGPRDQKEALEWYKHSKPWEGTFEFPPDGTFQFLVSPEKIGEEEDGSERLLYSVKFEDDDAMDFYWPGRKGLYDSFDSLTIDRLTEALKMLLKRK